MADNAPDIKPPPLVWEYDENDSPVLASNQFLVQHQKNEFFLTFGSLVLPPLLGTDEERRERLANISYVPIRVLGRYSFNRDRMVELIDVLQQNLANHDDRMGQLEQGTEKT